MAELVVGKRYEVTIRVGDRGSRRTFVGRYLGRNAYHRTHEFDLRPDFGTTGVKPADIMAYQEVA